MTDAEYMKIALELARQGAGKVAPDPMVGAVIVKDGEIVGKGWYDRYGARHAEPVAIEQAGERCKGAVIYTNLEPCCHFGKNPPCADAVIKAGISRVVSSMTDPNPKVNSGGFAKLRQAGIEVESGILEEEARQLNEVFIKHVTTKMPFVMLKIAQTIDGRIAQADGKSQWISGDESRQEVHRLRAEYDAVVVGSNTARIDNPELTVRLVDGRNPKRIIVAGSSPLPTDLHVFSDDFKKSTIVACKSDHLAHYSQIDGITTWEIKGTDDGHISLMHLLIKAGGEGLSSLLVEGGSRLASSLLKHKLVDKLCVVTAPRILGSGLAAFENIGVERLDRSVTLRDVSYKQVGDDIWTLGYPEWR